jgi:hypothetical protein
VTVSSSPGTTPTRTRSRTTEAASTGSANASTVAQRRDLTATDLAEWVAELAANHKPGTVRQKVIAVRLLLDFAGCDPNPARDPRVRLPKHVRNEPDPHRPNMFSRSSTNSARSGGSCSSRSSKARSEWGRRSALSGATSTWPATPAPAAISDETRPGPLDLSPEWLMELIDESCPMEDRTPERRVFQGITEASFYQAMKRACSTAKIPHYSPHSLRHRRITAWHQSGVVARELAERAGHARASMSLDVYSHVMPLDEVPADSLEALLDERG